jgi:hypothetical protein
MIKYLIFRKNDVFILLAGMLSCGLIAVMLGKDLCWDLANYHYYNPFAYLHQRWLQDYWPMSYVHMNLSPSADFLNYFLINYFSARKAIFLSGAIQGINFWLLYKIADLFWREEHTGSASPLAALAFALLGLWQPLVIFTLGAFENDLIVSIFILGAFYVSCLWLKKYSTDKKLSYTLIAASGLMLGTAAGLKMTVAGFGVASVLAVLCLPIPYRDKFKVVSVLAVAAVVGLLLSNGYWMLNLWQRFHNPFYPFFSFIFQGSDIVQDQMMGSYKASGWRELLFFPFLMARDGSAQFLEFEFPMLYILFVFTAGVFFYKNKILKQSFQPNLVIFWFYAFFIFSYIVWEKYFGVSRYIRSLAMLSPLLIYILLTRLSQAPFWKYFTFTVVSVLSTLYVSLALGGVRWPMYQNSYFNVAMPASIAKTQNALVLVSYSDYAQFWDPRPQTYLIPFFPSAWRFVGIPFNTEKKTFLAPSDLLKIKQLIASQPENFYFLTSKETLSEFYNVSVQLGLQANGPCEEINSDRQLISHTDTLLCPLTKLR